MPINFAFAAGTKTISFAFVRVRMLARILGCTFAFRQWSARRARERYRDSERVSRQRRDGLLPHPAVGPILCISYTEYRGQFGYCILAFIAFEIPFEGELLYVHIIGTHAVGR